MGNPRGFLEIPRESARYRSISDRINDYCEVEGQLSEDEIVQQASRCMDCGIPFCHGSGCPLGNLIPELNELVYSGHWKEALNILLSTNNFPEFTGRVCPALCETSCTLGINDEPVTVRQIEKNLIERGFGSGFYTPVQPAYRTGKKIAVIGSGPSGLAVADQLNMMGHSVVVFEKHRKQGGLLYYGIPNFKLDKEIVERRISFMKAQGIVFESNTEVGSDISGTYLQKRFDALCLACGAEKPRDLLVPGRNLEGIYFAMDFLSQQNKRLFNEPIYKKNIHASGKNVVIIGGGDTGSDCAGTAIRQGAASVTQVEILPVPSEFRHPETPWPEWPYKLKVSSSHEEGTSRLWNIMTKSFEGAGNGVTQIRAVKVDWGDGCRLPESFTQVPDTEFVIEADMVLLAMGFTGPESEGILSQLVIQHDDRGNVDVDEANMTNQDGIFACGDIVSGASLLVRAIDSGRKTAESINLYLNNN